MKLKDFSSGLVLLAGVLILTAGVVCADDFVTPESAASDSNSTTDSQCQFKQAIRITPTPPGQQPMYLVGFIGHEILETAARRIEDGGGSVECTNQNCTCSGCGETFRCVEKKDKNEAGVEVRRCSCPNH